jgi:SAM-dependent methyltransferase
MIRLASDYISNLDQRCLDLNASLAQLRHLTLDQFGELLLSLPDRSLPHLSSLLPHNTPDEVQNTWTGAAGTTLLRQSVAFLNSVASEYAQACGRGLADATVLDFGCGWGRLLRLLPYFLDPAGIYGCDAWDVSLAHAQAAKVLGTLAKSDLLPASMPFPGIHFDLIYAFSVFTHLSEVAARACLAAMRRNISKDGLVIITVRPEEFWTFLGKDKNVDFSVQLEQHRNSGFAFVAAGSTSPDYGDTTISKEYLMELAPGWKITRMGNTLVDPYQVAVCLRPA